ncbi:MAG TPA: DUF2905 domain-containing protein [Methylomirabilota bacterium]|jgi:hypothetical protein|nr:DUF2905 domain-containing protein [Methylomirabilota bacterium]
MADLGKRLIGFGVLLIIVGGILVLGGKVPMVGRLPGDFHIQRGNWSFYFPLTTSILISIILTLILSVFSRR